MLFLYLYKRFSSVSEACKKEVSEHCNSHLRKISRTAKEVRFFHNEETRYCSSFITFTVKLKFQILQRNQEQISESERLAASSGRWQSMPKWHSAW